MVGDFDYEAQACDSKKVPPGGYGVARVPFTSGVHNLNLVTWRPVASWWSRVRSRSYRTPPRSKYFAHGSVGKLLGGGHRLLDPVSFIEAHSRGGVLGATAGSVMVRKTTSFGCVRGLTPVFLWCS